MFYDRKRKEVLSSTTEASLKVEGDRHSRGMSIMDLKVHTQVLFLPFIHYYITYYLNSRRKDSILWNRWM